MRLDRLRPGHRHLAEAIEETNAVLVLTGQGEDAVLSCGDLPVTILTATQIPPSSFQLDNAPVLTDEERAAGFALFREWQAELTRLSTRGKQFMVADAGHYIHIQQPQAVIEAIRVIVKKSAGKQGDSNCHILN